MNSDDLQAVLTIADVGSMRQAAELLHRSQSSLSQMLKSLEQELGLPLFERHPSGLRPHPQAAEVFAHMRHTVAQVEQLKAKAAQARQGQERLVVMSASPSNQYILPDAIAQWRQRHSSIELSFLPGHQPEQMQALVNKSCDVGLLGMPDPHPEVVFHPIARVHLLQAVPVGGNWQGLSLDELCASELPMAVVPEQVCPGIASCVAQTLAAADQLPRQRLEVGDIASLMGAVGSGSAWGLVPQGFADLLPDRVHFSSLPTELQQVGSFEFCLGHRADDRRPLINDWLEILRRAAQRIYESYAPVSASLR